MVTGRPITAEELLAQSEWVRQLARRIVFDEDGADDVVQELHLAVWERRPVLAGDPRSWLAAVTGNLARRWRRAAAVRREHETRAAERREPDESEGVARMRLQRALAEAVLALRDPYRQAVIERHLEGSDYASIAARHGISEEAARKRVSRGLELLRQRLERELGGETRGLCLALLGVRAEPGEALVTGTLAGVAMGTKLAWSAALGLAVVSFFFWRGTGREVAGVAALDAPAPLRAGPAPSEDPAPAETPLVVGEGRMLVPTIEPAPGLVASADRERDLHGRVLDSLGVPLAGAAIQVRRDHFREYVTIERPDARGRRGASVAAAQSDARGEFQIPLPAGQPFDLWVEARGHAPASFPDRYAGELVEARLRRSAELIGRVTSALDGAPVAGARLRAWKDDASALLVLDGTTDEAGAYRFTDVEPGPIRLQAAARGLTQSVEPFGLLLLEGQSHRRDFELRPGLVVSGQVFDEASGAPIAGAAIGHGWSTSPSEQSDAQGRYELMGFPGQGQAELHVTAPGYGRAIRALAPGETSRVRVDVGLSRGRRVVGSVVDPDGEPLAEAYVAAVSTLGGANDGQPADWRSTRSRADGRFELEDLRADVAHALLVVREGFGTETVALPEVDPHLLVLDVGRIVLASGAEIRGRIADERGNGIRDCRVRLQRAGSERVGRAPDELNPYRDDIVVVGERTARSDDLGRFRFTDLAPGEYQIDASRQRLGAITVTREFDGALSALARVGRGERVAGIELVLDLGQSIAGRIVDERGAPVASMLVWLAPRDADAGPELNQVTGVDGRFEFRGLERGGYGLNAYATGICAAEGPPPFLNATLEDVESGTTDLEIVLERVPLTTGLVRNPDGTPAVKASVFAHAGGKRLDLSYTDAEGRFSLTLEPGTIAELFVRPAPTDGPYWDQAAIARIPEERAALVPDVGAGDERIEVDLPQPGAGTER